MPASAADEATELRIRVAELERLVMALSEKLATVAEHLGRLAERKTPPKTDTGEGHSR